jgi:hypothetical protein
MLTFDTISTTTTAGIRHGQPEAGFRSRPRPEAGNRYGRPEAGNRYGQPQGGMRSHY